MTKSKLPRLDNVGIVVDDLKAAISFFVELGLEPEGEMTVEGQWVDRVVGINGVRCNIAMMRTPDRSSRLELMKFLNPATTNTLPKAPVNALGIRRIMFAVNDIDDVSGRLQKLGAELVGEMVQYEDIYRLCYLRGPGGIIIALAEPSDGAANDETGSKKPTQLKMNNVLIVVEDLEATRAFFSELGLEPEGDASVGGPLVDSLIGLRDVRATLSLMRTPDGNGRIELDKFHSPAVVRMEPKDAPANTPGIRRIMFEVSDIDDCVKRLQTLGAELIGEVTTFEDIYRLCYLRGPEGIILGLAEQLGNKSVADILEKSKEKSRQKSNS